ncbi:MAG: DUF1189 family protein [Candidatus Paceibacterota bacterium]|jgi:hypothetical protein
MNIFKTIVATFYNPSFYEEAKHHSVKKVIGYYAKFSLLLALLAFIFAFAVISPVVKGTVAMVKNDLLGSYPQDLVLTVSKGTLSTNAPVEPVVIPLPAKWRERGPKSKPAPMNLAVINTKTENQVSFDEFKNMSTAIFFGKDYMINLEGNDAVSMRTLNDIPDVVVDRPLLEKIFGYASLLWIVAPFFVAIGVFVVTFMNLVYCLLFALLVMLVAYAIKHKLGYKESWKVAVYASTWPAIVLLVVSPLGSGINFLFTLLTLLVAIINLPAKSSSVVVE